MTRTYPRARGGDPKALAKLGNGYKLIPAHAGVIPSELARLGLRRPYPRARGGDPCASPKGTRTTGLSPRTRG